VRPGSTAAPSRPALPSALRFGWKGFTDTCFALFLLLNLATHSQELRSGPFTWLVLWRVPGDGAVPLQFGLLVLLPLLIVAGSISSQVRTRSHFEWGRPWLTFPLIALTTLALFRLDPANLSVLLFHAALLALIWFVYLLLLNQRPDLTVPIALVIGMQGLVAIGQFWLQSSLGLTFLGEPVLSLQGSGISVILAGEQPWLRAYGITGHPNALGAMLAVLLLILLPAVWGATGWRRASLAVVALVGVLGLLVSFSRSAWLGFVVGAAFLLIDGARKREPVRRTTRLAFPGALYSILAAVVLLFLWGNFDLVSGRLFNLDSTIEARSIDERERDTMLAISLIRQHPWTGVGAGNYLLAARALDPHAGVAHNIPLLAAAELGVPGGLLLLWILLYPFASWAGKSINRRRSLQPDARGQSLAPLAPLLALLLVSLVQPAFWPYPTVRGTLLLALVLARQSTPLVKPVVPVRA
jgi:O-antigen ligase